MDHKIFDLDVPLKTCTPQLLARILDAGYQCIALTQSVTIDDFNFSLTTDTNTIRKKTKEERQSMRNKLADQLKPPSSETLNNLLTDSHQYRATVWPPSVFFPPRLFKRLNLVCSEPSLAGLFFREFGETLNRFDIVSMCPSSSEALVFAYEQPDTFDLIAIDLDSQVDFRLSSKQYSLIQTRGLRLEFKLGPLLRPGSSGTTARSNLAFHFSSMLAGCRSSFSKCIVISSGATMGWEVRRPLAVVSILQSLGLQPKELAHHALTSGPCAVLTHGLTRSRTAHGAAVMLKLLSNPSVVSIGEAQDASEPCESPPPKKSCTRED
ncbi:hypothetical protein CSKR_102274 [Clonorchis sinensis]|uniref:Ribonuclease P/MRP protein subunit RPP1 n=2 Tax=Clonorchis sinensis TaxID=79923 RepID=H2KRR0_CLOSI|nr:hypothetical protein CSKR_102274 [Clonorchis sinensis]GAA34159.2 ribonuclease P/MRP protein subunit RPP1 [Clonorchis sinensis]